MRVRKLVADWDTVAVERTLSPSPLIKDIVYMGVSDRNG
jgi:hypothetical protein